MRKLGDLLYKLGDPRRQAYFNLLADDEDLREFLEAARKLVAHNKDKYARELLKMPIDTPDTTSPLVSALIAENPRIKQETAEPGVKHDQAFYHRLKMARLIGDGLRSARTEAYLKELTLQILKEADAVTWRNEAKMEQKAEES